MALSNWDMMGMRVKQTPDIDETAEKGRVTLGEVTIEVYRNFLMVNDKQFKPRPGGHYLLRIDQGEVEYRDVNILALRGPQQGIYAIVWTGSEYNNTIDGAFLCGVYGFEGEEFVGVTKNSLKWFMRQLKATGEDSELYVPKIFQETDLTQGKRCNAGDQYIAGKMGIDQPMSTDVGKAEEPVMMKILKNKEKK